MKGPTSHLIYIFKRVTSVLKISRGAHALASPPLVVAAYGSIAINPVLNLNIFRREDFLRLWKEHYGVPFAYLHFLAINKHKISTRVISVKSQVFCREHFDALVDDVTIP